MSVSQAERTATDSTGRAPKRRTQPVLPRAAFYTVGSLIALMFMAPLLWVVLNSFKSPAELAATPPTYIPEELSADNYIQLVAAGLWQYVFNSSVVAAASVAAVVVISVLAGYGFARFKFVVKSILFLLVLSTMMIPFQSIVTPLYIILKTFGLTDSLLGLILIYTTFHLPFAIFMMTNSFAAVPAALEEAAVLDGCGSVQVLRRVMIPLARPGIVTVALYAFFSSWNEFFAALIFTTSQDRYTLPVMLTNVQSGYYGTLNFGILEAGVVLTMLPCIVIFLILQRYYLTGLVAGATKG